MSNNASASPVAANANRLLWAGFTAILAAGVGFAVRGGILDNWGAEYGFTGAQLGIIGGAGFTGFCFGIFLGGVIVDKIGYGKLVMLAFGLHALSAVVTLAPTSTMDQAMVYNLLFWGTFIFAYANGTLEAVANPLVATLFPQNRTHYLNILHASWPLGMVLGGACGWILDDKLGVSWKVQIAIFLVPTVVYGLMFLGQRYPKSEAAEKGLSLGEMFKDIGLLGGIMIALMLALFFQATFPILPAWVIWVVGFAVFGAVGFITGFSVGHWMILVLFVAHALVGAVELGTDGWIQNITGNILTSEQGKILFVYTSMLMFLLRFCAHWLERNLKLSPVGLLLVCSILAAVGLNLVSGINTFIGALLALTVYAAGKTFFWPTMLAVVGDRFPRTGAVAMSIMGGIGMMSAGLLGSPGLGYAKDRFASEALQNSAAEVYEVAKVAEPKSWLIFKEVAAIDGKKLGEVQAALGAARAELAAEGVTDPTAAVNKLTPEQRAIYEASITGDRKTLKADSVIPMTMAVIYLLLLLYFKAAGGYKAVHIDGDEKSA